ncbi:MAG: winged helix-turn-helix domain-containing protein [Rectinemataceae bacterium]
MTVRIFADREPYSSYGLSTGGKDGYALLVSPADEVEEFAPVDLSVVPAERYIELSETSRRMPTFAYGPASLIDASFTAGCLDYLREPWNLAELFARASRLRTIRTEGGGFVMELSDSTLKILLPVRVELVFDETERKLLRVLMLNVGHPVPRSTLCFVLWGDEHHRSRAPDVHISSIRKRLESACPGMGLLIKAKRGLGYRLLMKSCA